MAKKRGRPEPKTVTAPVYIIGPSKVEWSFDMVNFYSADADSFGEYASRCFSLSRN